MSSVADRGRGLISAALHPFRRFGGLRDYVVTFATEGLTLLMGLAVFKLAAVYWGPTGFGEYVLARRGVALIYLPISCGMGLAITRYVAGASQAGRSQWSVFGAAAQIAGIATAIALLLLNVAPEWSGRLLLGEPGHANLIRAVSVAALGMVTHGLSYSFFRGRMQLMRANGLQFLNLGVVPLSAFAVPSLGVQRTVFSVGCAWIVTSVASLVVERWRSAPETAPGDVAQRRALVAELARYGLPRVPGEFALSALFALPAILTAHLGGVAAAGFVGFGTSLLSMVGSVFAPLGTIVLPSMSAAVASGKSDSLWKSAVQLTAMCVAGAALLTATLEWLAPLVVERGLGPSFSSAVPLVRVILLGGVPFAAYVVLRNMLDAASVKAINARNLILSVLVLVAIAEWRESPTVIPVAFAVAVLVLGLLTTWDTFRVLAPKS